MLYIYLTEKQGTLVSHHHRFPTTKVSDPPIIWATSWWNFKPTMSLHPHPLNEGTPKLIAPSDLKWRLAVSDDAFSKDYRRFFMDNGATEKDLATIRNHYRHFENYRLENTYVADRHLLLDDLVDSHRWAAGRRKWVPDMNFVQVKSNVEILSQFFSFEGSDE